MGFFSWKTSDSDRSIPSHYSCRETFTVHMITEDGQVFTEHDYEGYGVFGGKDIYELIADMNGLKGKNADKKRSAAISLLFEKSITNGERSYTAQGKDFFNWETPLEKEGGKTPNQLVASGEFKIVYPYGYGDFNIAASKGLKLPKLVEVLPTKKNWKKNWDMLRYPNNCEAQGYFYESTDEE